MTSKGRPPTRSNEGEIDKTKANRGEGGSFGERAVNEMHHLATASKFIMDGDSFSHHHLMEETR